MVVFDERAELPTEGSQFSSLKIFFSDLYHPDPGVYCFGYHRREGAMKGLMSVGQKIEFGKDARGHS